MAALEALLAHPVVAQVQRHVVAGGAGADHDHAAGGAHELGRGQGGLARVLEHDAGTGALAQRVPDRLAEGAGALGPVAVGAAVLRVRHRAPVVELRAVDHAHRAVVQAELPLRLVRDHRHRAAALGPHDLQRQAAQAAGGAPHQHHVALLHGMRRPAHQHAVGGGGAEQEAARGLPGEARGLGDALVRLRPRELAVAAVVGLIAPDARGFGQHRVLAREHPRVVRAPPAAVHDDLVADLDVLDVLADRPHDARAVAAAGVEILRLAELLPLRNHVEGLAQGGPHVVVVDARCHHVDQHLVGADGGRGQHLALPGVAGRAEAVLPHRERVHALRDFSEGRLVAQVVEIGGHEILQRCGADPVRLTCP